LQAWSNSRHAGVLKPSPNAMVTSRTVRSMCECRGSTRAPFPMFLSRCLSPPTRRCRCRRRRSKSSLAWTELGTHLATNLKGGCGA